MKLNVINSFECVEALLEEHDLSKTLTNNYILLNEYSKYIEDGTLFYWEGDRNLYLFVEKDGFYRLYYLINNVTVTHDFSNLKLVLEIIYRGNSGVPINLIEFWQKNGFEKHLIRDCFFLKPSNVVLKSPMPNVTILPISDRAEMILTKKLIDQYLDVYTGDRLTLQEIECYAQQGLLYCGYIDGVPCGILHADLKNNVLWLAHLVVHEDYRGLGLAGQLVDYYLSQGMKKQASQFQLWVINDNESAVKLYRNKGFEYQNKSTYSMIKLD